MIHIASNIIKPFLVFSFMNRVFNFKPQLVAGVLFLIFSIIKLSKYFGVGIRPVHKQLAHVIVCASWGDEKQQC